MRVAWRARAIDVREALTRARLHAFMKALADSAPRRGSFSVYFVGGATAVDRGWRASTIDADLCVDRDRVLGEIQSIKERLRLNVELARPEDFVPALDGSANRHLFIETIGSVSFHHYDPYAQLLSKLVRGFRQDLADAERFLADGLVDAERFLALVNRIPDAAYARHPNLSRQMVLDAVNDFLSKR
jgi:hypothetical protein